MSRSVKISGVIITYNEEKNIERCLNSLQTVCDEIVVVDSFSTDRTKEICLQYAVNFIEHEFEGFTEQKNFALDQCKFDKVLSLDADEALSDRLKTSILEAKEEWTADAFKFNRLTNYCGKWIKHGDWYPDTKVRLWNKKEGKWDGLNPHSSVHLNPRTITQHLKGDLLHYSYYSMQEHIERSIKYALISAEALKNQGKRSSLFKIIGSSSLRFLQDYILRLGFLEGVYGLVICTTNAYTTFLKYAYLRELNKE